MITYSWAPFRIVLNNNGHVLSDKYSINSKIKNKVKSGSKLIFISIFKKINLIFDRRINWSRNSTTYYGLFTSLTLLKARTGSVVYNYKEFHVLDEFDTIILWRWRSSKIILTVFGSDRSLRKCFSVLAEKSQDESHASKLKKSLGSIDKLLCAEKLQVVGSSI